MASGKKKKQEQMSKKIVVIALICTLSVLVIVGIVVSAQVKKHKADNGSSQNDKSFSYIDKDDEYEDNRETTTEKKNEEKTTALTTSSQATVQTTAKPVEGNGIKLLNEPVLIDFPSSDDEWKMILLNTNYRVASDVDSNINFVSAIRGSDVLLDSRAAAAYQKMYDAGRNDGVTLTPCSGYRSYSLQKDLYYELVDEYLYDGYSQDESEALASTRRMPPGSSEHNIGIAMDICYVDDSFKYSAEYKWLCENAEDYGFILRYTESNKKYTGVKSEPWHWRYVGVENAKKINASGLSLEEYLGKV